jgi:hypothetical protein
MIHHFEKFPVQHPLLLKKLSSLKIPQDVWEDSDLKECNYVTDLGSYFGFTWPNDAGGIQIMSAFDYTTWDKKPAITTVTPGEPGQDAFLFSDYLAYLQARSRYELSGLIIVLNFHKQAAWLLRDRLLDKRGQIFIYFRKLPGYDQVKLDLVKKYGERVVEYF